MSRPGAAAAFVCLLLAGALAGADGGAANGDDGGASAGAAEPAAVHIEPLTFDAWQQRLAGYSGNVVVVDFWATWCLPCMERFPKMVELERRYAERGVVFVSMSLDDRTDDRALAFARDFLAKQGATFDSYRMDESVPRAFAALDLLTIPAVYLYDRDGTLRTRLTEDDPDHQFTDEDVQRSLDELLAEGP